jgi:hypothetical protein
MNTETLILKARAQRSLEAILKHCVSVHTIGYGKNKTVTFYDYDTEKWMKCTLKHNCLIANIREDA